MCAAACPNNCLQCTVNTVSGAVECDTDKCESGYGLKDADKTCVGKSSTQYSSVSNQLTVIGC